MYVACADRTRQAGLVWLHFDCQCEVRMVTKSVAQMGRLLKQSTLDLEVTKH